MYKSNMVQQSELMQILLLDNLYTLNSTESIIFQGGTALRWVYGGTRFSEDLDFVTSLPETTLRDILKKVHGKMKNACIAQFGPGESELRNQGKRENAVKVFFIYRPEGQRERIAVKLEFEALRSGTGLGYEHHVLSDLTSVSGLLTTGKLILPYTSTIIPVETAAEIISDKVRALFERPYLKGRDFYDIWWLVTHLKIFPDIERVKNKLTMYKTSFVYNRQPNFFLTKSGIQSVRKAIVSDLSRFIPQTIYEHYKKTGFEEMLHILDEVIRKLMQQGIETILESHATS